MTKLNPEISKELESMVDSLESAKDELRTKFNNIFNEFTSAAFDNFYSIIESDTRYNFSYWVRKTCDEIIEGLISGDLKYIAHANLISDYDWEKLRKMRLAIWETAGGEIANSTIASLLKENEVLKKELQYLRSDRRY